MGVLAIQSSASTLCRDGISRAGPIDVATARICPSAGCETGRRDPADRPGKPEPGPADSDRSDQRCRSTRVSAWASDREAARTLPVVHRPAPPSAPAAARDDFQRALYYQRAGDFERSLTLYRAVLQGDELNVEAHNNLGMLYIDKGLSEDAVAEFHRALSIAPRYLRAHNNLGVTLLELGRSDAARAEFRAVLMIDPRNIDALVNLALAQRAAGEPGGARATLTRALALDPHNAAAHYNLGLQFEDSGDALPAVEHYEAFLQYAGPEYAGRAPDVRARIAALDARRR